VKFDLKPILTMKIIINKIIKVHEINIPIKLAFLGSINFDAKTIKFKATALKDKGNLEKAEEYSESGAFKPLEPEESLSPNASLIETQISLPNTATLINHFINVVIKKPKLYPNKNTKIFL
jgi:hypothetical protein